MSTTFSWYLKNQAGSEVARLQARQALLRQWQGAGLPSALADVTFDPEIISTKNCENLIGQITLPLGVAGPVQIHSSSLNEEVMIPLATTEGALVASV